MLLHHCTCCMLRYASGEHCKDRAEAACAISVAQVQSCLAFTRSCWPLSKANCTS